MSRKGKAALEPVIEPFTSARSAWYPYALFYGMAIGSMLLFWIGQLWTTIAALVLASGTFASVLLELTSRPNPLRWILPKGRSQNVVVRLPPSEEAREQVVLLSHLDTHRTPLVFSSERWVRLFRLFVPTGMICFIAIVALFIVDIIAPRSFWRLLSLPFALFMLVQFLITLQADSSPYTPGANDNASGVGVALSLAERLKEKPLAQTAVWVVLSGCEEVGCYGAEAFAQKHRKELGSAAWISIDNVGGDGASPAYLTHETFLLTTQSDPNLITLADRVAERCPKLGAQARRFRGAYTEGSTGGKYGFRVLTILAIRRDGGLPEWHRPTDTIKNLDTGAIDRVEAFFWEFLREVDRARH